LPREKLYYVYIMASKSRVIYVGMTGFLMARVLRHRAGEGGEFTRKYLAHRLVYYELFHQVGSAIARETELKKWRREKKLALIEKHNPTWQDLAKGWGKPAVMTVTAKADSSPPLRAIRNDKSSKVLVIPHMAKARWGNLWSANSGEDLHSLAGNEPVSKPNFPTGGQMSFVRLKRFLPQLHHSLVRNNSRPLRPGSFFVS